MKNRDFFFSEVSVLFFTCLIFQLHKALTQVLFTTFLSQLFLSSQMCPAVYIHSCALLSTSAPLKTWTLNSYVSVLFAKMNVESVCRRRSMGGQRVNMHCVFWVVRGWRETVSLISGCLQGQAECAEEHLGDSPGPRLSRVQIAQPNIDRMMGSQ